MLLCVLATANNENDGPMICSGNGVATLSRSNALTSKAFDGVHVGESIGRGRPLLRWKKNDLVSLGSSNWRPTANSSSLLSSIRRASSVYTSKEKKNPRFITDKKFC